MKIKKLLKALHPIKAGVFFGVLTGLFSFFNSFDIINSITSGVLGGVLFGLFSHFFVNSKMIKNQTKIDDTLLLPEEEIMGEEAANFIIVPKDFELKRFAFDNLLWMVGMQDREALGGKIYITNYRIIFKSHKLNRLRGMVSIFLPTIEKALNTSNVVTQKITIKTESTKSDFIVHNTEELLNKIEVEKGKLDQTTIENIQKYVLEYPDRCSHGLKAWNSANTLNNLLLIGDKAEDGISLVLNPIGAIGAIFMREVIDKTIAEKWQKRLEK